VTFNPATISVNATSKLTISIGNANAQSLTLSSALTDAIPAAGVTISSPNGLGGTCSVASVSAAAGSGTVTYANGASVPPGGCTITVNVTAAKAGSFTDTIPPGALQTSVVSNTTGASAQLIVTEPAPSTVPDVAGKSTTAAVALLAKVSLQVKFSYVSNSKVPFNTVISQMPAAGSQVSVNSVELLSVSTGSAADVNDPLSSVPGLTRSQQSIARSLERTCQALSAPTSALSKAQQNLLTTCTAIINDNAGGPNLKQLQGVLDAVSGKELTAIKTTELQFVGVQAENLGERFALLRQGIKGVSLTGLDLGLPTASGGLEEMIAAVQDMIGIKSIADLLNVVTGGGSGDDDRGVLGDRLGIFINGNLRRGSHDITANESAYDYRSNGVTIGADYRFNSHLVWGLALFHASGSTDFSDGFAHLNSKSNLATLYGTYYTDNLYVDWLGTYGHNSYRTQRSATFVSSSSASNCVGGSCTIDTTGSTGAKQYNFAGDVGYTLHLGSLSFGPELSVSYTRLNVRGFTEDDPTQSGLALNYSDQLGKSLLAKGGGFVYYALSTRYAVILPQVRVRFIHEFENDQEAVTARYAADPSVGTPNGPISNFVVFTDQPDRNYFEYAADLTAQFKYGISAFVNYSALGGAGSIRSHEASFGLRIQAKVH
jgi:uncharacterized protein YhjY with autotransporter beta-barrel domain